MTEKRRFGCLGIGLIILLAISGVLNFALIGLAGSRLNGKGDGGGRDGVPKLEEQVVTRGKGEGKIALIPIKGIISSSMEGNFGDNMVEDVQIALDQAVRDEDVKAIILAIDSPGGEVTASDVIYHAVQQAKAKSKKPVIVSMGSLAASGGYYIACAGDWIVANETTLTGSIGVIISTYKYKDLLGKVGVEPQVFKSGKFKDMLSGTRDMTPEEAAYVQALVMQTYGKFVGIVASERKLPEQQLRDGVADGRVISGKDALTDKLVNQLGYYEDAVAKARELGKAEDAEVVRYKAPFAFGRILKLLTQAGDAKMEINLTQHMLPPMDAGKLYLLPSYYAP